MERQYWHVCTEGLEKDVIFKSDKDFIFGMNGVAVCAFVYNVRVMAFCLMTNHVHFVVEGTEYNCRKFIMSYRRRLSILTRIAGTDICMKLIDSRDYLLTAIAYVLRNPMTSGQNILPFSYRWGSGKCYFRGAEINEGKTLAEIGSRNARKLLHSNSSIPETYRIDSEGMVCPESYVASDFVERLFRSAAQLLYYVSRNDSVEINLASDVLRKTSYTDTELIVSVQRLCKERFLRTDPQSLSIEERCRLAEMLRKIYGIGIRQISRLTGVAPDLLRRLFK